MSVVMIASAAAPSCRLQIGQRGGQRGNDLVVRQRFQNHAGGKRQHLFRLDVQVFRHRGAGFPRPPQAVLAGAGVGVAGIDHQGADAGFGMQMFLADGDRRGAEAVLREYANHFGIGRQRDHQTSRRPGFLMPAEAMPSSTPATGRRLAGSGAERLTGMMFGAIPFAQFQCHASYSFSSRANFKAFLMSLA
jgi:hypothetical protein